MPTIELKGKSFVYAHHLSVPFRELVIDAKKSLPAKGQKPSLENNLRIQRDNLRALKALLPASPPAARSPSSAESLRPGARVA